MCRFQQAKNGTLVPFPILAMEVLNEIYIYKTSLVLLECQIGDSKRQGSPQEARLCNSMFQR